MFVRVHFLCLVCRLRAPRQMPKLWWRTCCKTKAPRQQACGAPRFNRAHLQPCWLCKGRVVTAACEVTDDPVFKGGYLVKAGLTKELQKTCQPVMPNYSAERGHLQAALAVSLLGFAATMAAHFKR
jgi:hypothetical protein